MFEPTPLRVAISGLIGIACFSLPQKVPLEWFPLNEPGDNIHYLEIKCAADGVGDVKIYQNLTRGINELDTIQWPISAIPQAFTYTFPLPDAPIVELRLDPPAEGVSLVIENFRIIDRRGDEYRRFTADMLRPVAGVAAITPSQTGFTITSSPESESSQIAVELFSPIVAKGINDRSFLRCLYSTSYLSLMLWILLLAVLFTFWRPTGWRDFAAHVGFMACLAIMFAFVGNRGLIKNSWHYAQFEYPDLPDQIRLELDLVSSAPTGAQLFWDSGNGYSEAESDMVTLAPIDGLQTARFNLPKKPINSLRLDPRFNTGEVTIRGIRIVDWGNRTHAVLPLDALFPGQYIDSLEMVDGSLEILTSASQDDPTTEFKSDVVAQINTAIAERLNRFNY
jgi:hypothetical protein